MKQLATHLLPPILLLSGLCLAVPARPQGPIPVIHLTSRPAPAPTAAKAPAGTHLRALAAKRASVPLLAFRGARPHRRIVLRPTSPHPPLVVDRYRETVQERNTALPPQEAEHIASSVLDAADRNGVDSRLVLALVACESNFRHDAVSRVGALGLGQLMPGTAASLGVTDPFDVDQNVEGTAEMLGEQLDRMASRHGRAKPAMRDVHLALACYNAGPGMVRKYGGVPPFHETNQYVKRVTGLYYQLAGPGGLPPVGTPIWP